MINKINQAWCEMMHDAPMWPIHGQYECRTCGRHWHVNWNAETRQGESTPLVAWNLARVSK